MQMKGITCCGDCGYYNWKKHRCTRATDQGPADSHFYADCPLPDVSGWTDVNDEMPEPNLPILFCSEPYRTVHPGVYVGNNGCHDIWKAVYLKTSYTLWEDEVSYWMYLPEPPKDGESDG